MKDILHLFMVPFTGLGLYEGYRGDKWFKNRIEIFKKYPLKALMSQTEKDFVVWLCFREQERDNPLTQELYKFMETTGLKFIFTYGGIPIWDDKYKNDNLLERLEVILPQLKKVYNGESYIYETCQPSDDFFHENEAKEVQAQEFKERGILLHRRGYVLNDKLKKLADWNPTSINPPFYTIMYHADTFFNPREHYNFMKNSKSHEDVAWLFKPIYMPDYRYCVLIHGNQISTTWYHPYREAKYHYETAKQILRNFGIELKKPGLIRYGTIELKAMLRYWIFRLFIKGRLYKILKIIKNKYEYATRGDKRY